MTAATRRISEENLHQRLALPGPRDELTELADTIDGLLGRLETAFEAQRRFVANASHEVTSFGPATLTGFEVRAERAPSQRPRSFRADAAD